MGTAPESAGCVTNPIYVGIDDHPNVLSILPQVELFSFAPWTKVQIAVGTRTPVDSRSEEHTSELQSLMRISYAVFCLKKKKKTNNRKYKCRKDTHKLQA